MISFGDWSGATRTVVAADDSIAETSTRRPTPIDWTGPSAGCLAVGDAQQKAPYRFAPILVRNGHPTHSPSLAGCSPASPKIELEWRVVVRRSCWCGGRLQHFSIESEWMAWLDIDLVACLAGLGRARRVEAVCNMILLRL